MKIPFEFIKRAIAPVLIFLIVFGLWWGAWRWVDTNITAATTSVLDSAAKGQFGDQFGAINALFSGLAFAGIIFTIFLQRGDLRETRTAMSQERFDNTFFQLLQVHIAITEKMNISGTHKGSEAFVRFNEHLKSCDKDFYIFCALQKLQRDQVRQIKDSRVVNQILYPALNDADVINLDGYLKTGVGAFENFLDSSKEMHESKIVAAYVKSSSEYIDYFSHYFRNLYHILKFISESSLISEIEKQRYSRFVRSQLSQFELVALFYNSIAKIDLPGRAEIELGHPKMGTLLQRFDTLQNMSPRNLFHPIHQEIFNKNNSKGAVNAN